MDIYAQSHRRYSEGGDGLDQVMLFRGTRIEALRKMQEIGQRHRRFAGVGVPMPNSRS